MWPCAETGFQFLDDPSQAIGSCAVYVPTHVDNMLAAGDSLILHLIVDVKMGDHSEQNHWTRRRR